jgi:hypothetical protein
LANKKGFIRRWKIVWLVWGIMFTLIALTFLFLGPLISSITGTVPFSGRARAMISFFWVWMLIYNGAGSFFLYKDMEKNEILIKLAVPAGIIFSILQYTYMIIEYFELVVSEIIWGVFPIIWSALSLAYLIRKNKYEK